MGQSTIIFKLVCFFTPWTIIGISSPLVSNMPIALLLALFDIKYISGLFKKILNKNYHEIKKTNVIFIFILFYFVFDENYKNQIWGIFISFYFINYIMNGNLNKAEIYVKIGLLSSIIFGSIQFIAAQFFHSDALSNQKIFNIIGIENFGIYQNSGSVVSSQIFEGLYRVSGGAAEPALFSMTIFLLSQCIKIRNFYKYFGYFISLSKVSLIYLTLDLLRYLRNHRIYIFISAPFFVLYYLIKNFHDINFIDFYYFDHSTYIRFLPVIYAFNIDLYDLFFGIGRSNYCDAVQKIFFYGSLMPSDFCQNDVGSFLGSLFVEKGLIGLVLFLLIPFLFYRKYSHLSLKSCYKFLFIYILGTLNIHYLTFFTPALFYLGNVFARIQPNNFNLGVDK